ncbi:MAG: hypothetical protein HYV09_24830 [Deltaproteobacteria bacterium]|nr:hypothetical protein [Deltaproteobacteria bacterium]
MRTIEVVLLLASLLQVTSCSGQAENRTIVDAAEDVDYGDGPTTGRPDDGPDTSVTQDADADLGSDATAADADAAEVADDAASADTADVADAGSLSPSRARINEVYVDRYFEGDVVEWVEITAPPATPIDALWIRVIDKAGAPVLNLRVADAGTKMKTSGLWVVGSEAVAKVDKAYDPKTTWGLPNEGGSIQLTRNDGVVIELVDVVGYGTAPASTATEPKKTIETAAAALPTSGSTGKTIGRKSVPGDTDDNSKDFCVMSATPGAPNGACP